MWQQILGSNGMGNDPFVDFPAGCWLLALGIHSTPPTLLFPSGYSKAKIMLPLRLTDFLSGSLGEARQDL